MSSKATHFLPIALCEANGAISAPAYIQILPTGAITPNDGRGPWNMDNPQAVIDATKSRLGGLELMVDYNHQSEHSARNGQPAPAAGWISELEARPEGIFGKVKWTERGENAVKSREFRYISPVFNHDAKGRIKSIVSCALTNTPALEMQALCEAETNNPTEERSMDSKLVAQALGLSEKTTEAEIITACAEARKAQCEAQKEPDPAKYVPIDAHNAVMAELAKLKKEQCEAKAAALVSDAKAKGKLAPAMENWAKSYAQSDPGGFKAWLEAAPELGLDKEVVQGKPEPDAKRQTLSDEERVVCQAMGIDEKAFLEEAGKWQN